MTSAKPEVLGFVGLGRMGRPMVRHLLAAGRTVWVKDIDKDAQKRLVDEDGARSVESPADLAHVDAVVTMLPDSGVVREVFLDADSGLAPHLRSTAVVVDMSSSDPGDTRELGAALRAYGVQLVDAPVSGGVEGAERGTLSIMLGADDEAAAAAATSVVEPMSRRVFRTGGLGSGHAMKALNNFVAAAGFTAAAEALAVGTRFGLDATVMLEVMNASTGRNFSTESTMPSEVVTERFGTGFGLGLMTKDVAIAGGLAELVGVETPLCERVHTRLSEAVEGLGPAVDHSRAYLHWRQQERSGSDT